MPSRRIPTSDIIESTLWWNGPRFLQEPFPYPQPNRVVTKPRLTPQQEETYQAELCPLQQQVFLTATIDTPFPSVIEIAARYSNWNRLRRHVCWWIRLWRHYVHPCRQQPSHLQISPNNLRHAENLLVYAVQQASFKDDFTSLK
ncbi:unnamed protein product, partial [Allacma fusca]